jgi:hypothetical protein
MWTLVTYRQSHVGKCFPPKCGVVTLQTTLTWDVARTNFTCRHERDNVNCHSDNLALCLLRQHALSIYNLISATSKGCTRIQKQTEIPLNVCYATFEINVAINFTNTCIEMCATSFEIGIISRSDSADDGDNTKRVYLRCARFFR